MKKITIEDLDRIFHSLSDSHYGIPYVWSVSDDDEDYELKEITLDGDFDLHLLADAINTAMQEEK